MAYYRLYHVRNGRFCRVDDIQADEDEQAEAQALKHIRSDPAELWCGSRKVKIFQPEIRG